MTYYTIVSDIISWPYNNLLEAEQEMEDVLEKSHLWEQIAQWDVCIGKSLYDEHYVVYDSNDVTDSSGDISEIENIIEKNWGQAYEEIACQR